MKVLDLYCGAGGASYGYWLAGFEVVGVDWKPQPRYPFEMTIGDALLSTSADGFDLVHASPPCQFYATSTSITGDRSRHQNWIPQVREMLQSFGVSYVIENVPRAPLVDPVTLCGSMFDLGVRRHRVFESSFPIEQPACDHAKQGRVVGVHGHCGGKSSRGDSKHTLADWERAMGIDWMTSRQLAQAIPPAYTEYIGRQFVQHIDKRSKP